MKILVVTQYFWPENFRINDLSAGLVERGHQVTVLTGIPNYPDGRFFPGYGLFKNKREEYKGARIIRVPLIPRGNGNGLRLALNFLSFTFCSCLLSPLLCRDKFDLIFVFEPSPITVCLPAIVLKKFKSTPILFWVQDLWPESLSATGAIQASWILNMVNRLVRFIYRNCDKVLVTSQAYVSSILEHGINSNDIYYYPQSVESLYLPVTLECEAPEHTILPTGFRVMFAGNIGAAQSFETILEAAKKLEKYSDIKWIIIGEGRLRVWAEAVVQKNNLEDTVFLLGRYPLESMPHFFSLADSLLVTLKNEPIFALTIPGKIQSYLACGKPIIAALNGEGSRLVREAQAGLTCPAEDADALADTVLAMYRMSQEQRDKMGRCGRKFYEANFDRDMLISRLEGWMDEVCPHVAKGDC